MQSFITLLRVLTRNHPLGHAMTTMPASLAKTLWSPRSIFLLLVAVAFPVTAQSARWSSLSETLPMRHTHCLPGPAEPSLFTSLRPTPTVTCSYDHAAMAQRLGDLIGQGARDEFDVVSLYSTLSMPPMSTSYDSPRSADYRMTVFGADGWRLYLSASEAAYPLDDALAPAFTLGKYPERLVALETLDVNVAISIYPKAGASGPDGCITAEWLGAFATNAGWHDTTAKSRRTVMDGGRGQPKYSGPNGRLLFLSLDRQAGTLPTKRELKTSCVTSLQMIIPPKTEASQQ